MFNWNPSQYLKFVGERTQPSVDLASRIRVQNPSSIIDIGCGPGNSTRILRERWPNAKIVGLDSSGEMIAKAKRDFPGIEWIVADAGNFDFTEKYDIVFSNAAIQWMPDHETLLKRLFSVLTGDGVLAFQVPADSDSPLRQGVVRISSEARWSSFMKDAAGIITYHDAGYYYNVFSRMNAKPEMWETVYYHVLGSHAELVDWYKGTGLRPFIERLPDESMKREFENEVLEDCVGNYEPLEDGRILFPFRRLFVMVQGKTG